jgi:hypothetical protein
MKIDSLFVRILAIAFVLLGVVSATYAQWLRREKPVRSSFDGASIAAFNRIADSTEYRILSQFYKKTNGRAWKVNKNWLKGRTIDDMAKWHGVIVRNGDVSEIHLDNNNLTGEIPKALYQLHKLRAVSFQGNKIEESADENYMAARVSRAEAPVVSGKNVPMWSLSLNGGSAASVDWKTNGAPIVSQFASSDITEYAPVAAAAVDVCGNAIFYVMHSGFPGANQLHFYNAVGTKISNNIPGSSSQALNGAFLDTEVQVIPVPKRSNEWYIIYSLYTTTSTSVGSAASIVYARVSFSSGLVTVQTDKRQVPICSNVIHGKAVSVTADDPALHYLYLVEPIIEASAHTGDIYRYNIHRYIIDEVGINYSVKTGNAEWIGQTRPIFWSAYDVWSGSCEVSPDGKTLAITNRYNPAFLGSPYNPTAQLILYDVSKFGSNIDNIINLPDLTIGRTNMNVTQYRLWKGLTCLDLTDALLNSIEFSPSSRYLYAITRTGVTANSYLLQIDLKAPSGKYEVTIQNQAGYSSSSGCIGSLDVSLVDHSLGYIQSAYNGRLYFTKENSSTVFVIPRPDAPMPGNSAPHQVSLEPRTTVVDDADRDFTMPNGRLVYYLPENIDGFDYIPPTSDAATFTLNGQSSDLRIKSNETTVSVAFTPISNKAGTYWLNWGDGNFDSYQASSSVNPPSVQKNHNYQNPGTYQVFLSTTISNSCPTWFRRKVEYFVCPAEVDPNYLISSTVFSCGAAFTFPKIGECGARYLWSFGDGTSSTQHNPVHSYGDGTFTVNLTVTYGCGYCTSTYKAPATTVTVNSATPPPNIRTVSYLTDKKAEVISSSATTFAESWPLDNNDPAVEALDPFLNASRGVWRAEGSYVYNEERSQTAGMNLRKDGIYTLESFPWPVASLDMTDKWIKATAMTRYNAFNYELENKDVMGIYSGALYDYNGQLQTASGTNMRNDEMAFTSFETDESPSGNFMFKSVAVQRFDLIDVQGANGNNATAKIKPYKLEGVAALDVIATDVSSPGGKRKYMPNVPIACTKPHSNPEWTIVALSPAPFSGDWSGQLKLRTTFTPSTNATFDGSFAHTGKRSLKIASADVSTEFEQRCLKLDKDKTYYVSAWVSTKPTEGSYPVTTTLGANLGFDLIFYNYQGIPIGSPVTVTPTAQDGIIEGWQQIKKSFTVPQQDLIVKIRFKNGSGDAYYDDIRIHPDNGMMKTFVYDLTKYKLMAILDEQNFASLFYYDAAGNLYLTKKETEEGIKTISENVVYTPKH